MSEATNAATEIVADAAEVVADEANHVADISRGITGRNLGWGLGGLIVGAGVGGVLGYIFCQRRLESQYAEQAAEEISEMAQHYREKVKAHESNVNKGDLEELVREKGYASSEQTEPPMAVTPPNSVVDAAIEEEDDPEPRPEPKVQNVFQDVPQVEDNWDWHKERSRRSPVRPYVIHVDERHEMDDYDHVSFTYYEDDDVLSNDADEIIAENDRERLVGEANLEKFGHGSPDDPLVVYIRNDKLKMVIEVNKSPNSYAEEVHGFEPEIRHSHHRHRGRITFDDE